MFHMKLCITLFHMKQKQRFLLGFHNKYILINNLYKTGSVIVFHIEYRSFVDNFALGEACRAQGLIFLYLSTTYPI